jgi:FAD/FMN-containing dehydrogenase
MGTPIVKELKKLGISIKTPLDPDWEFYSSTYNVRVPAQPEIVILPGTIEQVSQAVVCAAKFGLKVQARCGGHSYASHSNGGVDGSAVVDLRKLQDIELRDDGIVRVGGGVRLGNLARTIYQRGQRALAHGTCPAVGVGGHFTHGGFGLASRAWGLSMDQIFALDVVMADGELMKTSAWACPELFYVSVLILGVCHGGEGFMRANTSCLLARPCAEPRIRSESSSTSTWTRNPPPRRSSSGPSTSPR